MNKSASPASNQTVQNLSVFGNTGQSASVPKPISRRENRRQDSQPTHRKTVRIYSNTQCLPYPYMSVEMEASKPNGNRTGCGSCSKFREIGFFEGSEDSSEIGARAYVCLAAGSQVTTEKAGYPLDSNLPLECPYRLEGILLDDGTG